VSAIVISLCTISASAEGWGKTEDGKSYFELNDKKKLTGFCNIDGSVYYFDNKGMMVTGNQTINGYNYSFGSDGKMMLGWKKNSSGDTLYFDTVTGVRSRGFCEIDKSTYYFLASGVMLKDGSYKINNKTYTFGKDGKLSAKTPYVPVTYTGTLMGIDLGDSFTDIHGNGRLGEYYRTLKELETGYLYTISDTKLLSIKNKDKYYTSKPLIFFEDRIHGYYLISSFDFTYIMVFVKEYSTVKDAKGVRYKKMTEADINFLYDYYEKILDKTFGGESLFYAKPINNLHVYSSKKSNKYVANPDFITKDDIKGWYNLNKLSVYSTGSEMVYLFTDKNLVALVSISNDYKDLADNAYLFELFYNYDEA
jgi:hypothetical protein